MVSAAMAKEASEQRSFMELSKRRKQRLASGKSGLKKDDMTPDLSMIRNLLPPVSCLFSKSMVQAFICVLELLTPLP